MSKCQRIEIQTALRVCDLFDLWTFDVIRSVDVVSDYLAGHRLKCPFTLSANSLAEEKSDVPLKNVIVAI